MELKLNVSGFTRFSAMPQADKSVNFYGAVKIKGGIYFFDTKTFPCDDGTYRFGVVRWETFTGKPVRGKVNLHLEDLIDTIREEALFCSNIQCIVAARPQLQRKNKA